MSRGVTFETNGVTYRLHYPLGVLAQIQEDLGLESFDKLPELILGDPEKPSANMKALLVIVSRGIKKQEGDAWIPVSQEEAGELDYPLTELSRIASQALLECIVGPKVMQESGHPLAGNPVPPRDRKSANGAGRKR